MSVCMQGVPNAQHPRHLPKPTAGSAGGPCWCCYCRCCFCWRRRSSALRRGYPPVYQQRSKTAARKHTITPAAHHARWPHQTAQADTKKHEQLCMASTQRRRLKGAGTAERDAPAKCECESGQKQHHSSAQTSPSYSPPLTMPAASDTVSVTPVRLTKRTGEMLLVHCMLMLGFTAPLPLSTATST